MNPRCHIRMWIGAWELVGEVGRASMRKYTRIYMQLMSCFELIGNLEGGIK
jgi:hypothetical protein